MRSLLLKALPGAVLLISTALAQANPKYHPFNLGISALAGLALVVEGIWNVLSPRFFLKRLKPAAQGALMAALEAQDYETSRKILDRLSIDSMRKEAIIDWLKRTEASKIRKVLRMEEN